MNIIMANLSHKGQEFTRNQVPTDQGSKSLAPVGLCPVFATWK
jgi:hypothetical protein